MSRFKGITQAAIEVFSAFLGSGSVGVDRDSSQTGLMIEVTVLREQGTGRSLLLNGHSKLSRPVKDGVLVHGEDPAKFRRGFARIMEIALHGLGILPDGFAEPGSAEAPLPMLYRVSAGVFVPMSGESNPEMTLAGSGNKGTTFTIPVFDGGSRFDMRRSGSRKPWLSPAS